MNLAKTTVALDTKKIRLVFFGTPAFALPTLRLLAEQYNIIACVTQPDKPQGRTQVLTASPVKQFALEHAIPVWQPTSLRPHTPTGQDCIARLQHAAPDIAVVVAYGKIIPPKILAIPRFGCINVHGSLLPKLRGAAPIAYAILQGFRTTGVTIMRMDAGMDTGPMLATAETAISHTDTSTTLHDRLAVLGAELLATTLPGYITGSITPQPQVEADATYTKLIDKTNGLIDWSKPAVDIERLIRAFTPWPGTYTLCQGKRIKILAAHLDHATQELVIDQVQPDGKKPMPYADFLRGYPGCPLPPPAALS